MKKRKLSAIRIVGSLILFAAVPGFVGCHSTGYDRSDATARGLQSAAAEVQAQSRALEATMDALNDLVNKPSGDLKPQFAWFSTELDRLVALAARNERIGRRMQARSAAYFKEWDSQLASISYESVRKSSEIRRAEVSAQLDTINKHYQESEEVIHPLIGYLWDIRKALSTDLTMAGLAAVKNIVANAEENAGKVRTVLAKLATDLTTSGAEMSSVAFQNTRAAVRSDAAPVKTEAPEAPK